ncbi:hypothetical protein [Janthinobacterium sp. CG_23.3]|uniref:hypothetical protein n=1 Tax=Janthinobacterium sp. CG_23.3 TaxID=3349634 RepID=UPI0038D4224C
MQRLAVSLLLCCAACSAAPPAARAPDTLDQIRALVGAASCAESSQCRTLALGAKACGGPEAYLAWSTAATPAPPLRALAARHQAQRQAENAATQLASNCAMLDDPGALCRLPAGVCALRAVGQRGAD